MTSTPTIAGYDLLQIIQVIANVAIALTFWVYFLQLRTMRRTSKNQNLMNFIAYLQTEPMRADRRSVYEMHASQKGAWTEEPSSARRPVAGTTSRRWMRGRIRSAPSAAARPSGTTVASGSTSSARNQTATERWTHAAGCARGSGVATNEGPDGAGLPAVGQGRPPQQVSDPARNRAAVADSRSATAATVASWAARSTPTAGTRRIWTDANGAIQLQASG